MFCVNSGPRRTALLLLQVTFPIAVPAGPFVADLPFVVGFDENGERIASAEPTSLR